jgi:transporter family-2 protein
VLLAPALGIGIVTVMLLMGQIMAARIIDQFGFLRAKDHPINLQRLIGVLLLGKGVFLINKF